MPISRIQQRFDETRAAGERALLPYLTAGLPDAPTTGRLIERADALGVAGLEIGFPYSDSIADGPVIQDSFYRVLARGHTLTDTFQTISDVRPRVRCSLIAMASCSIVHRTGLESFMQRAAEAGFDGVLLPDVPTEEAALVAEVAGRVDLAHIALVAPTTTPARRKAIVRMAGGFIYQVAAAGTTGERDSVAAGLKSHVEAIRRLTDLPVCVGFGISRPEHVRAVSEFADGVIVGSAIVRRICEAMDRGEGADAIVESVSAFVGDLLSGTRGHGG